MKKILILFLFIHLFIYSGAGNSSLNNDELEFEQDFQTAYNLYNFGNCSPDALIEACSLLEFIILETTDDYYKLSSFYNLGIFNYRGSHNRLNINKQKAFNNFSKAYYQNLDLEIKIKSAFFLALILYENKYFIEARKFFAVVYAQSDLIIFKLNAAFFLGEIYFHAKGIRQDLNLSELFFQEAQAIENLKVSCFKFLEKIKKLRLESLLIK